MKQEIWFYGMFIVQLVLDIAFFLTCKWAWTLNLYLDSFADNYFADHICVWYFVSVGIILYLVSYFHSGSLISMYSLSIKPRKKEQYFCYIHGPTLGRIFISFGCVLYYHSSFGLALWGGYIGVALIASVIIESQILLPHIPLMDYGLIFGRIRIPKPLKQEHLD
ncbi:hypothetical protein EHI8A_010370 [Entamoeba histolytica HM-1:IMSS-B]|uniref:Uncharacterized protein n=5 Tax=Entamoeba histolytica TaxID=5759 RepID=C4LTZ8_ENTH1|nr:hypothetical protein EHI_068020 [Entamoeba histolytica HM-1:IMSS]EMD46896.1 Hypothetical protein EHI5A_003830 [Entamoeba histolytica KU27]EMH77372.1 hypothetical protein EHI8A_010370 [Entamoeba histolytica HM-1:IMSS-B]ENY65836.1 hypothetical protein EHI7A_013240 [Entamoeba histolytica HM-1:IMSS-A]GAT92061.1 hypothetical protein CL6EHI_068020 [Entamoeba histolytica]EAL51382.1 hypothetical protein EHI_068020 [Entamoeba histolytica HM-1:IMSS]|eukprot:XP_656767.1 hypothetical protein EHI_068020 [Entamoeba histolytica HM-1:IMSS]